MITGIHHVSMHCFPRQLEEVMHFYTEILGLPVKRQWAEGVMFDTGSGVIEVLIDDERETEKGIINHYALAADDVDTLIRKVAEAGYPVFKGPKDICIASDPPLPARIVFCRGPLEEEIEFFHEK